MKNKDWLNPHFVKRELFGNFPFSSQAVAAWEEDSAWVMAHVCYFHVYGIILRKHKKAHGSNVRVEVAGNFDKENQKVYARDEEVQKVLREEGFIVLNRTWEDNNDR